MPSSEQIAINENKTFDRIWFLFFEKIYRSLTSFLSINGSAYFGTGIINPAAKVQIDSTTQGFLPPRMATAQKNAIIAPVAGLAVFDTDLGRLCIFDGLIWDTY